MCKEFLGTLGKIKKREVETKSISQRDIILNFLQNNSGRKFTAREIAEYIFNTYPEHCKSKQQRSKASKFPLDSDSKLIGQIIAEITIFLSSPEARTKYKNIKTTEGRPRQYYFTEQTDQEEVQKVEIIETKEELENKSSISKKEYELYPLLINFLKSELQIYSKRIDEKHSVNSRGTNGNKWLYPDIVGVEDLTSDWHREIKDCVQQYSDKKTKLWSFEVKILINRSNIREAFFQCVSNSSWANFGYLVASEIQGSDTMKELRILSGLHGIGFILLRTEDYNESEIILPAKEKTEIDWNIANRLAEENKDFLNYIKLIRHFYQTGDFRDGDWG